MKTDKNHVHDRVLVYAVIFCLSYMGCLFALHTLDVHPNVGIFLTLVTVLSFLVFFYKYYRSIFFMDEVQVKIQMEAVVIAFALGLLLLMTLGLLDLFVQLNPGDWGYRHLFSFFILFYFIGLVISRRKYHFHNEKHD